MFPYHMGTHASFSPDQIWVIARNPLVQ